MVAKFMKQLLCSIENNPKKLKKILKIKDSEKTDLIEGIYKSQNRYKQSMNVLLNTSIVSDKERLKILGSFDEALINQYFDVGMTLINYLKNDKYKFLNIFKGSSLFTICQSPDRLSNRALRLIFDNPIISDKERHELFCYVGNNDESALYHAVKKGYYENVEFILHHFGNNKKQIIKWLNTKKKDTLFDADDECILLILRYFKNDRRNLLTLIGTKNAKDDMRVFDEICRENKIKCLKCILYECSPIHHKDILRLLCNKKYFQQKSPIFDTRNGIK
eukprot:251225_1